MKIIDQLIKLGLEEKSAKLYSALIEIGYGNVSEIAKASGLYRPTIYKLLPELIEKNLISKSTIGKRTVYVPENPKTLFSFIEQMKSHYEDLLPGLIKVYETSRQKPLIRSFIGKEGIDHIYKDMINSCRKNDIIYRYESPKDYQKNKKYYPCLYIEKAAGKNSLIEKFVITNEKTKNKRKPQLSRYSKVVPKEFDLFEYDITQLIYANKVAFIDYQMESACIIESNTFSQFQKKIFKLLFNKL